MAAFVIVPCAVIMSFAMRTATPLIVSIETTRFLEPLDKYGFVDFAGAINAHFSAGIDSEDNFAVALYEALGPRPDNVELSHEFFHQLGMPVPPDVGVYILSLNDFATNQPGAGPDVDAVSLEQHERMLAAPWTAKELPLVKQ